MNKRINDFFFYRSIYTYILTGYLNVFNFQNEIKSRDPEILTDEVKSIRVLNDFRQLSNDEFALLVSKVLNYAEEGKYGLYSYAHIADLYLYFIEMKMINSSKKQIFKIIESGLEIAKQKKQINDYELENLLHFHNTKPEVEKIKQTIKKIHHELKIEGFKNYNKEFVDVLLDSNELALSEFFKKHIFSKDLFPYIEIDNFFNALKKVSNKQIYRFMMLLKDRYNATNIKDFLSVDYDFLKQLEEKINDELIEKDIQQPQKYLYISLTLILNDICKRLSIT